MTLSAVKETAAFVLSRDESVDTARCVRWLLRV